MKLRLSHESHAAQARRPVHGLAPMLGLALAACIPDLGSNVIETEGGKDATTTETAVQEGGDAAIAVTRKVEGLVNDGWVITDENGTPGPDGRGTLDVPAGAKVRFILTSDPAGEAHKFMITIPGYESADTTMPPSPATVELDWTAPPTPGRFKDGINCDVHKGMVADVVTQ